MSDWVYLISPAFITFACHSLILSTLEHEINYGMLLIYFCLSLIAVVLHKISSRWIQDKDQFGSILSLLLIILVPLFIADLSLPLLWMIIGFGAWVVTINFMKPEYLTNSILQLSKLYHFRFLWSVWTKYTIQTRYNQMLLGILWSILQPLATSIILAIVFSSIRNQFEAGDAPFVSYLLIGIAFFNIFSETILTSSTSLIQKLNLFKRFSFPAEILVFISFTERFIDFVFNFITLAAVNVIFFGLMPNELYIIGLIPLFLIQILNTLGLSFMVSIAGIRIRDIPEFTGVILRLLFYLTPIIYPQNMLPEEIIPIIYLNPMVSLIEGYRDIILFHRLPDAIHFIYPLATGIILFIIGYTLLKQNEHTLPDYN